MEVYSGYSRLYLGFDFLCLDSRFSVRLSPIPAGENQACDVIDTKSK